MKRIGTRLKHQVHRVVLGCIGLLCCALLVSGQGDFEYRDKIYTDNIHSVKFHVQGLFTSYPIVELNSNGVLTLSFDDLDGGDRYYKYKILHCDKDWNPSDIEYYEYIDGYEEEEIRDYAYSISTLVDYTHYWLHLPNRNTRWTKSGNYLLIVYEDNAEETVVITRRFMVVDTRIAVVPERVRPANVAKLNTHQEINFSLVNETLRINNPKNEISVSVLQNGRWDNAISDIESRYERGETFLFNYQDKIVFPAGKDFRNLDLRSLRFRSRSVLEITQYEDVISVILEKQKPRVYSSYFEDVDLNGQFVIQTSDNFERNTRRTYQQIEFADSTYLLEIVQSVSEDDQVEADYIEVRFTIEMPEHYPVVYVFGALSDWDLTDRFRLEYDARLNAYTGLIRLKQGYYDYYFVTDDGTGHADIGTIEGNWYETDNDYTILVYFTPFGARYDRLIAAYTYKALY